MVGRLDFELFVVVRQCGGRWA